MKKGGRDFLLKCNYDPKSEHLKILIDVYSCFEKGSPTKLYATMPKGIIGNGGSWSLIEALGVSTT